MHSSYRSQIPLVIGNTLIAAIVIAILAMNFCVKAEQLFSEYPSLVLTDKEVAEAEIIKSKVGIRMTHPEVAYFLRFIRSGTSYFEFGCG